MSRKNGMDDDDEVVKKTNDWMVGHLVLSAQNAGNAGKRVVLRANSECFTFEPVCNDPSIISENIVIRRSTGDIQLNAQNGRIAADEENTVVSLLAGEYMIVITDRIKVGRIGEHDIFMIKDYKIISFARNNLSLSERQINDETAYIALLHSHLQSGQFYFSYGYDITHSQQRLSDMWQDKRPLWERADERFFWNQRIQSKLIDHTIAHRDQNLSNFILPVMNGFVEFAATEINKRMFTFALLSRRSRHRAGTRYFSRGIDAHGNVSNFNETEQLVILESRSGGSSPTTTVLSHVQTRGSIPVFWAQINNIKYTPKLQIFDDPETGNAFRRHFETQKRIYGPQLVINLINKKGYEEPMGSAFSKQIDILNDPQIRYHHFDFHQECSKMRWHRVSLLLDHFHSGLVSQGYFKAEIGVDGQPREFHRQTSVVRTNCMDCLDRTNVVQSVIARWMLNRQLQEIGILSPNETFESHRHFETLFRNVWADNADVVSCAYSGTGALKTDYTRTGQRTKMGALKDLQNSIIRYVKNNFLDGARQDAYDLVLNYDVQEAGGFPFVDNRPMYLKIAPLVVLVAFAMLTSAIIVSESLFDTSILLFLMFCVAVLSVMLKFILANGIYYVNWPKLVPLGYNLPVSRFSAGSSEPKFAAEEIELGWKNE
ncbi:hypothetical protein BGZ94_003918 [Podila epigama]|nr:hypothetical protein BGZ94_003918 [Podila epigama]